MALEESAGGGTDYAFIIYCNRVATTADWGVTATIGQSTDNTRRSAAGEGLGVFLVCIYRCFTK
ncbi:hypothetical protein PsorP6_006177 [Peronosclerospora sorghi]|uniref:Uncharacterized protein n=1 Tax=Peronosclerospora sorghi TaxID=230839 RepID=A0ACC0W5U6_9STRA|nr:hypothetical protein PsorP6_006177 [Peronosclerospora sorghi]